jgi:hypothetical protein
MDTMNQSQSGGSTFVLKHAAVRQNRTYDYIYGLNFFFFFQYSEIFIFFKTKIIIYQVILIMQGKHFKLRVDPNKLFVIFFREVNF